MRSEVYETKGEAITKIPEDCDIRKQCTFKVKGYEVFDSEEFWGLSNEAELVFQWRDVLIHQNDTVVDWGLGIVVESQKSPLMLYRLGGKVIITKGEILSIEDDRTTTIDRLLSTAAVLNRPLIPIEYQIYIDICKERVRRVLAEIARDTAYEQESALRRDESNFMQYTPSEPTREEIMEDVRIARIEKERADKIEAKLAQAEIENARKDRLIEKFKLGISVLIVLSVIAFVITIIVTYNKYGLKQKPVEELVQVQQIQYTEQYTAKKVIIF